MPNILSLLSRRPLSSVDLQNRLGVSQATISRQIGRLGRQVVRLGRGRSTEYAAVREAFGAGNRMPIYRVDTEGRSQVCGELIPLAHGGYLVEGGENMPLVFLGMSGTGVFEGLPYFLDGLRPQGFMGRHLAASLSGSGYPSSLGDWSEEHIGMYLTAIGRDLPGDLIIGHAAMMQFHTTSPERITHPGTDYPMRADRAMAFGDPGSSAGGEQPKFTAVTESGHVIVKFTPPAGTGTHERWRDILVAEHLALGTLRAHGVGAAASRLHNYGERWFLEVDRFDRVGTRGRRPMVSLTNVDAEFTGTSGQWVDVMTELERQGLVTPEALNRAMLLQAYGHLINNTDMHLGNLSLGYTDSGFDLLPVYDMTAMGFRPLQTGEVQEMRFELPRTRTELDVVRHEAEELACYFWQAVADDSRVSTDLRGLAASRAREYRSLPPTSAQVK